MYEFVNNIKIARIPKSNQISNKNMSILEQFYFLRYLYQFYLKLMVKIFVFLAKYRQSRDFTVKYSPVSVICEESFW